MPMEAAVRLPQTAMIAYIHRNPRVASAFFELKISSTSSPPPSPRTAGALDCECASGVLGGFIFDAGVGEYAGESVGVFDV